jgi:hypothetical protein
MRAAPQPWRRERGFLPCGCGGMLSALQLLADQPARRDPAAAGADRVLHLPIATATGGRCALRSNPPRPRRRRYRLTGRHKLMDARCAVESVTTAWDGSQAAALSRCEIFTDVTSMLEMKPISATTHTLYGYTAIYRSNLWSIPF